jgi:hypothetical protein
MLPLESSYNRGCNVAPIHVRTSGKPVFDSDGEFHGYRGGRDNNRAHQEREKPP